MKTTVRKLPRQKLWKATIVFVDTKERERIYSFLGKVSKKDTINRANLIKNNFKELS